MIRLVQFHSRVARSNWTSLSSGSGGSAGLSERSVGSANVAGGSPVLVGSERGGDRPQRTVDVAPEVVADEHVGQRRREGDPLTLATAQRAGKLAATFAQDWE